MAFFLLFLLPYYNRLRSREKTVSEGKEDLTPPFFDGGAFLHPFCAYTERNKTREAQMSTIFDYLKEVTYDSIYDRPFNELDVLALTELTYLFF